MEHIIPPFYVMFRHAHSCGALQVGPTMEKSCNSYDKGGVALLANLDVAKMKIHTVV